MKEKIEDIIWKRVVQEIPTDEAVKQILSLFDVSNSVCKHEDKIKQSYNRLEPHHLVALYLNSLGKK